MSKKTRNSDIFDEMHSELCSHDKRTLTRFKCVATRKKREGRTDYNGYFLFRSGTDFILIHERGSAPSCTTPDCGLHNNKGYEYEMIEMITHWNIESESEGESSSSESDSQ